jgi:hypothetical protein
MHTAIQARVQCQRVLQIQARLKRQQDQQFKQDDNINAYSKLAI